ncbi:MAG: hypothetical protein LIP05_11035 [Tannerellaceae bacterium]|nr:hypothetical protein [Tannerellaceae bacterium]
MAGSSCGFICGLKVDRNIWKRGLKLWNNVREYTSGHFNLMEMKPGQV